MLHTGCSSQGQWPPFFAQDSVLSSDACGWQNNGLSEDIYILTLETSELIAINGKSRELKTQIALKWLSPLCGLLYLEAVSSSGRFMNMLEGLGGGQHVSCCWGGLCAPLGGLLCTLATLFRIHLPAECSLGGTHWLPVPSTHRNLAFTGHLGSRGDPCRVRSAWHPCWGTQPWGQRL